MPDRFYRGMPATEAMGQLNGLNSDVQAVKDATATGVASAAQSAAQAAAARDAAVAAWGASTEPTERLAPIARTIHAGAVVDVFLYDTSKDSDGGAWRQRCRHTSWENEALVSGKWLGQHASTVAAVEAGGLNGDFFQFTVNGTFWEITDAASGIAVEIFRGNTREFPALAAIVAEVGRVVIYDATKPDLPMWMVFTLGFDGITESSRMLGYTNLSCTVALNGVLFVGHETTGGHVDGLNSINFPSDNGFMYTLPGHYYAYPNSNGQWRASIANREGFQGYRGNNPTGLPAVIGVDISDIAVAVLDNAPIDPQTGLPLLTTIVGTRGGATILKHDGTFTNWLTDYGAVSKVDIRPSGRILWSGGQGVAYRAAFRNNLPVGEYDNTADGWYDQNSIPARYGLNTGADGNAGWLNKMVSMGEAYWAFGSFSNGPLQLYRANPFAVEKSMVAHITSAYNSGWQVGDIRGAWLADTLAETVRDGADLVTNGTFTNDLAGWMAENSGTGISQWNAAGYMELTSADENNRGGRKQTIDGLTVGRTYVLEIDKVAGTAGTQLIVTGATGLDVFPLPAGKSFYTFGPVATNSVDIQVNCYQAGTIGVDNISVYEADLDRSVQRKDLTIKGQLTKVAVAAGAQLVGYSGFGVGNYLTQPYSSLLDFGMGDFHVRGWFNKPNGTLGAIFCRCTPGVIGSLLLIACSDNLEVYVGTGAATITTPAPPPNTWNCVDVMRLGGILYVFINGALMGQVASTTNISHATAGLVVGAYQYTSEITIPHNGSLALWRVSATAVSSDQISQMYRDELALFQPGAQCTIAGGGATVTSLAFDDTTNLLHVCTNDGFRSAFKGLLRVENEWPAGSGTGSLLQVSAAGGAVLVGAENTTRFSQPAMLLRDELRRRAETRRAMAREEIPLDFDSIAAQTTFPLPIGFTAKGVWVAGTKKRRGPTKDYTVTFDGYRETVVFGVSPGATWVQITANRSI